MTMYNDTGLTAISTLYLIQKFCILITYVNFQVYIGRV